MPCEERVFNLMNLGDLVMVVHRLIGRQLANMDASIQ